MSLKLDLLSQIMLKEGDDDRTRTFTISDLTTTEYVWHFFQLAATAQYEVPLGGIGTDGGKKLVYLETDKRIKLDWVSGQTRNDIPAGGIFLAMLTNRTHVYIKPAAATTTTVQVAVFKF